MARKSKKQMTMTTAEIAEVYATWTTRDALGKQSAEALAETYRAEGLTATTFYSLSLGHVVYVLDTAGRSTCYQA